MKTNRIILLLGVVCVLAAAAIYAYAFFNKKSHTTEALKAANIPIHESTASGTYPVVIDSIISTPDAESIKFTQIVYVTGAQAKKSAQADVQCEGKPIEYCVPSLSYGFYAQLRASDIDFAAVLTSNSKIELTNNKDATVDDLRNLSRDYRPTFDVTIKDHEIMTLVERIPPGSGA